MTSEFQAGYVAYSILNGISDASILSHNQVADIGEVLYHEMKKHEPELLIALLKYLDKFLDHEVYSFDIRIKTLKESLDK